MTVVEPRRAREDPRDPILEQDLAALRSALEGHPFPTRQDDLIAACLCQHTPARLCSRLSTLSHATLYTTVDQVLDDVAAHA